MRVLRLDEFKDREGESFELVLGDRTVPFYLAAVRTLPRSNREGGAFVLEWEGPHEPELPQDIYTLRYGGEDYEMFIVPLGRDRSGAQYEAVFN